MQSRFSLNSDDIYSLATVSPARDHHDAGLTLKDLRSTTGSSLSQEDFEIKPLNLHESLSDDTPPMSRRQMTRSRTSVAETVLPEMDDTLQNDRQTSTGKNDQTWTRIVSCVAETVLPDGNNVDNSDSLSTSRQSLDFSPFSVNFEVATRLSSPSSSSVSIPHPDDTTIVPNIGARLERFYRLTDTRDLRKMHLCADLDLHVSDGAGWDIGYRNVSTILSSLLPDAEIGAVLRAAGIFDAPDASEIALGIERAWALGYDEVGARHYEGSVAGKWIGGTEVAVLFHSLGLRARCMTFDMRGAIKRKRMMDWVFRYFDDRCAGSNCLLHTRGDHGCCVAPLFCQWSGHSVTIVGAERTWKGETRLLVLDPVRSFAEHFRGRGVKSKMLFVRRGENHPQFDVERMQIVFLDMVPLLKDQELQGNKGMKGSTRQSWKINGRARKGKVPPSA